MELVTDAAFANCMSAEGRGKVDYKLFQIHFVLLKVIILLVVFHLFGLCAEKRKLFVCADNLKRVVRINPIAAAGDVDAMRSADNRGYMYVVLLTQIKFLQGASRPKRIGGNREIAQVKVSVEQAAGIFRLFFA